MIYLDNAATTKPFDFAIEKAQKFNSDLYFNPSALYQNGIDVNKEIKEAKEVICKFLGISMVDYDVIFTSCGSESDNTAIFCATKRGVFLTSKGEHSAVYKSFLELKNRDIETVFIDLNSDGTVNTDKLFQYVENNRVDFVSIVHVNNETGGINNINYIADKIKNINPNIIFHSDGVQAFSKVPIKMSKNIDLYSISAHKINGLKGTGVLIKKKKTNISPLIFGGGQENGFRSGTENVFGIKTFQYALESHIKTFNEDFNRVSSLKTQLLSLLDKNFFTIISGENSSPYILTVSAKGLRGEVIMHKLETFGIIVGNGSACSSKNRYSRIIEACGYNNDVLDGVLRISFSVESTMEEVNFTAEKLNESVKELKGVMG